MEVRGSLRPAEWRLQSAQIEAASGSVFKLEEADEIIEYDEAGECNVNVLECEWAVQ